MAASLNPGPRKRRTGGMTPIQLLAPPKGGPPSLYHAARRARVAEALGPALRRFLVDVTLRQGGIVLVFDGPEWQEALRSSMDDLRVRVQAILARPGAPVTIECCAPGAFNAREEDCDAIKTTPGPQEELLTRFRRVADEILRCRGK